MTTSITFWNVKRLGQSTAAARATVLQTLASQWRDPDLSLYCELSTMCANPPAQNLTYRRENASQLCYGAVSAGVSINLDPVRLVASTVYRAAGFGGGNQFDQLADRALAHVGNHGGAEVYLIHAPSGGRGLEVMSFVATSLAESYPADQPWLVVGDFNVTPEDLEAGPANVAAYIHRPNVPTFRSHSSGGWAEYDYALANFNVDVRAMRSQYWREATDHSPILVQF